MEIKQEKLHEVFGYGEVAQIARNVFDRIDEEEEEDLSQDIIDDLVALGIPRKQIKCGNDAPRGGKLGDFISCKYSGRCKFFKTTLPAILADWLDFEEGAK